MKSSKSNTEIINVYKGEDLLCYLKPIQENFTDLNYNLCFLLSKWRIENPTISTGTFQVTEERTKKWLIDLVINREDRLIFMIHGLNDDPIGHIGLSNINFSNNSVELDSVLRGKKNILKGLMSQCVKRVVKFGLKELRFSEIDLSVFSDNNHAVDFYKKLNFKIIDKIPLLKVIKDNETKYEIVKDVSNQKIEKYYFKMRFQKELQKKI
ncbi:MAG: GNAT family N-acetyltransferase [Flavobacteriaceae bacterium]|nr:GNAT family N-acetyltransferase [Flavobacteriaceae bacterium]